MKVLRRWLIAIAVIAALGVVLELCLRALLPSLVEGGARLALRVPEASAVTVETEGSLLLNALRWRIADVTITAEDVPLADGVTAETTLEVGSMPLFPAFGKLRDGTATFVVPAEQLGEMVQLVSRGLADWGEMREGTLVGGGVLTDQQFDLPHSPAFEIPYEGAVGLAVENGEIVVTPSDVVVQDQGPVGQFLAGAMTESRAVCFADRIPAGVKLTGIEVDPSGVVTLEATLSEGLLSRLEERFRGSC